MVRRVRTNSGGRLVDAGRRVRPKGNGVEHSRIVEARRRLAAERYRIAIERENLLIEHEQIISALESATGVSLRAGDRHDQADEHEHLRVNSQQARADAKRRLQEVHVHAERRRELIGERDRLDDERRRIVDSRERALARRNQDSSR